MLGYCVYVYARDVVYLRRLALGTMCTVKRRKGLYLLREVRLVHRLLFGFQFVGMHRSSIAVILVIHCLSSRVSS